MLRQYNDLAVCAGFLSQVPVALLDTLVMPTRHESLSWTHSDPFFCSGYRFSISIARGSSVLFVGITFHGPALDFALLPNRNIVDEDGIGEGGASSRALNGVSNEEPSNREVDGIDTRVVDLAGLKLSVERQDLWGERPATFSEVFVNVLGAGFLGYGSTHYGTLSGFGRILSTLSQHLDQSGYIRDGHLHLKVQYSGYTAIPKHR